eukprot:Amastigsp_a677922_21.p3 type:complete len:177 gc:universal Amastigsp_a677922_21:1-531(+)
MGRRGRFRQPAGDHPHHAEGVRRPNGPGPDADLLHDCPVARRRRGVALPRRVPGAQHRGALSLRACGRVRDAAPRHLRREEDRRHRVRRDRRRVQESIGGRVDKRREGAHGVAQGHLRERRQRRPRLAARALRPGSHCRPRVGHRPAAQEAHDDPRRRRQSARHRDQPRVARHQSP